MNRLLQYLLATLLALLTVVATTSTSQAQPSKQGIGITGHTTWGLEYHDTLAQLQQFGIDIQDGCSAGDLCVNISHYRANDGTAGIAIFSEPPHIKLNDNGEQGYWYRRTVLMHELGHIMGLQHSGCNSAMHYTIPMCGHYLVGYTAEEIQQVRNRHGI